MENKMKKNHLLTVAVSMVLILSSMLNSCLLVQSSVVMPVWMEKGAYTEYSFDDGLRPTSNVTVVAFESGTYKWECIDLVGTFATLKITAIFNEEKNVSQFSTQCLVDVFNRSVYRMDGIFIGITNLWLVSNPDQNEEVILWDLPPDKIVGNINYLDDLTRTPQGKQKSYEIDKPGIINGNQILFSSYYDFDTGIMTAGLFYNDATLKLLDVVLMNSLTLADTNVDLGDGEKIDLNPIENSMFFGAFYIIIGVSGFLLLSIMIYRTQRKKHKRRTKR